MTAPEPWRDVPPPPTPKRRPAQPDRLACDKGQHDTETEFGFGGGLVAPCYNGKTPADGGIYMPKAPPVDESGRPLPRKRGEAYGHPGEVIAR
jgi:hypothetical protein